MTKVQTIIAITALIVAIFSLIYTTVQVGIARADLEAKTRPYLSIENIRVEDKGEDWITIMIGINNLGELPATRVQPENIVMGGKQIAWISEPDEYYPAQNHTTEDGVIISAGGVVVIPEYSDLPDDMIFFPQKLNTIKMPVHGTTWRTTITDGSVMDIGLDYSWGDRQYWYVATAMLSEGEWKVILERGD